MNSPVSVTLSGHYITGAPGIVLRDADGNHLLIGQDGRKWMAVPLSPEQVPWHLDNIVSATPPAEPPGAIASRRGKRTAQLPKPASHVDLPGLPRMFDFSTLLELTCLGRDALYRLIHSGVLPARRFGLKFYVLESNLRAWQASLPKEEPTEMPELPSCRGHQRK